MSSQAASISSIAQPQTTAPTERPEQPAFNDAKAEYLEGFLDQYLLYIPGKKGDKKKWVKLNVYPKYTAHFNSARPDGLNLASLFKACLLHYEAKMTRWYSNKTNQQKAARPVAVPNPITVKKPRATSAEALFAKSCEAELRVATKSQLEAEEDDSLGHNLIVYRKVKKNAYMDLSAAEKEKWEALAKEHNERIRLPPSAEYIYKHQGEIVGNATAALQALIGQGWSQHGDIIFFLQGGYCNKAGNIKTFHTAIGTSTENGRSFREDLNWNEHCGLFKKWASNMLPAASENLDSDMNGPAMHKESMDSSEELAGGSRGPGKQPEQSDDASSGGNLEEKSDDAPAEEPVDGSGSLGKQLERLDDVSRGDDLEEKSDDALQAAKRKLKTGAEKAASS